jgi:hypothetical protein
VHLTLPISPYWLAMYVHMHVCAFETWAYILDIKFPTFKDGYGFRNVGLLAIRLPDVALSPRDFHCIHVL